MAISFFIEYAGEVVQFPVNPEEIKLKKSSNNSSVDIVQLGEVTEFSKTSLAETSFSSFLPATKEASYVQTKNKFWKPSQYIDFIEKIRKEQKACRFIVSDTKINMLASIENFEYSYEWGANGDVNFDIEFKEYREHAARFVKIVQQVTKPNKPVISGSGIQNGGTNKVVTQGCTAIVNGRLHRDSYGSGPGQTEVNATRKINFIANGRSHPYHCTTMDGGWRGWVTAGSVRVI
ncbi:hypothetical protein R6Z02_01405 [Carnobacterium maltaromaticum]|uniref:Uncharacterized protein n=1 Tax=Carnobacterium maltaromaticum TaxID=2751 RepID=A0AAW9KDT0_CARML|nr:hypothetical protein [Carnobacterium maltaromaticum]MDW5522391.1 hypothetical protein [Carnobacterium maltaromaticum]MDZ5760273.1 hypothetical protein [Carnobacterium maltaromaticum]CAD5900545.1 conserved hypothetical protein [Carnobacterium maltaromaticum]